MSHLLPLLSALQRAGCDVHLLCLGDGGLAERPDVGGCPSPCCPWTVRGTPGARAPAAHHCRRTPDGKDDGVEQPRGRLAGRSPNSRWDVVHTHGMRANLAVAWPLPGACGRAPVCSRRSIPTCGWTTLRPPGPGLRGTGSSHARRGGRDHLRLRCSALSARGARLSGGPPSHGALRSGDGVSPRRWGRARMHARNRGRPADRHSGPLGSGEGPRPHAGGGGRSAPNPS